MKEIAQTIASKVSELGFTKNGKPMVADQGAEVAAAIAGCRNAHVLRAALKKRGPEPKLALTPENPEECDGTDFIMKEGVPGIWIKVDGLSVHICRGSFPRANDGGLRVYVYGSSAADDAIAECTVFPEDLNEAENDETEEKAGATSFRNFYLCPCGAHWEDDWDCACNDHCPDCDREIEPYASDDGSVSEDEVAAKLAEVVSQRAYLVADAWNHIFEGIGERTVRFVFDRKAQKIVFMQAVDGRYWLSSTAEQVADVEDSLKHANDEALVSPHDYGLTAADYLPAWAEGRV